MRIAMVVSRFPKPSETFIVSKFLGLLKAGFDVHIVCQGSSGEHTYFNPDLATGGNWRKRVHRHWPSRPRWLATALLPLAIAVCFLRSPRSTAHYLLRGWRRFGPDVVRRLYLDVPFILASPDMLHFEFGALARDRVYLKDLLDSQVVVSFRGYDLNFSGLEDPRYYEPVWAMADGVHCLGQDLWQRAQDRGCPPDKPHVLIPPAVDVSRFSPDPRFPEPVGHSPRPYRIVSVGRLEWKKGYEYALEAIRELRARGLSLEYRIVGNGAYLEPLAYCRHQLGLETDVQFLGGISQAQVREELQRADVFLLASVSEGFCNAVVEAQAMGLPVVVSDAGGLPENVADGQSGFVVPRRDASGLADRLMKLAQDPLLRIRMGKAGRDRVLDRFQLGHQIQAFGGFYRGLQSADERSSVPVLGAWVR